MKQLVLDDSFFIDSFSKETKAGSIAAKGFDFQKICLLYELLKYKDDYIYGFYEMFEDLALIKVNGKTNIIEWIKLIQVKGKYIFDDYIIDFKDSKYREYLNKLLNNINIKMIKLSNLKIFGSFMFSGILKYYNNNFKSGISIDSLIKKYGNNFQFKTSNNFKKINNLTTLDYFGLNSHNFSKILINSLDELNKYNAISDYDSIISQLIGFISLLNDKLLIKSKNMEDISQRNCITFSNIKDIMKKSRDSLKTNFEIINDLYKKEKNKFFELSNDFTIMIRNLELYVVEFKLNINTLYDKIVNKINEKKLKTSDEMYFEIFKTKEYKDLNDSKKLWLYFEALIILKGD